MKTGLFILIAIFTTACNQQIPPDNVYAEIYRVGTIPGLDSFRQYNEYDKRVDSIYSEQSKSIGINLFKNNRSRIFLESYTNGQCSPSHEKAAQEGIPALCLHRYEGDSLIIWTSLGFFAGDIFEIKIIGKNVESYHHSYADNTPIYKYHLTDTSFTDELLIKNKFQYLILDKDPASHPKQLTGYFTFTTPVYYEKSIGQETDTNYVKGKIYFTFEL